jgi:hypothetical protein
MHGLEACVDITLLAASNTIHGCLHVIINAAPGDTTEHAEGMPVGIEQHLVRLQRISPHQECPTVRQLGVCNLQFDAFATNRGPVFAPVELECFTRCTAAHAKHV